MFDKGTFVVYFVMIIAKFGVKQLFTVSLLCAILCLTAGGCNSKDSNADITWMSLLDKKIHSLAADEKQTHSLKRLKQLHQEKVLRNTINSCVHLNFRSLTISIIYFIFRSIEFGLNTV